MAKNALQAQLLKAGLIDAKQAKKADKQVHHAKKTGDDPQQQLKSHIEQARQEKIAKDQALSHTQQQQLEQKTLHANIIQMIGQHKIDPITGDIGYQFIDALDNKIKKIYVNQSIYNALVAGSAVIARHDDNKTGDYAILPRALADKIEQRMSGFIIQAQSQNTDQTTSEDDPYAAYVIPDDLMW